MSDFSTRWEEASDPTGPLAAGKYVARVTRSSISDKNFDPSDKRKYIDWEFTIDEGASKNRKIWQKNFLDPKPGGKDPIGIVKGQCKSLSIKPASIEELGVELTAVLGKRIEIDVKEREWNGKVKNEVRIMGFAPSGLVNEKPEGDDVPF